MKYFLPLFLCLLFLIPCGNSKLFGEEKSDPPFLKIEIESPYSAYFYYYIAYVSIDPASLTFLKLYNPFYVDTLGNDIPITISSLSFTDDSILMGLRANDYIMMANRPIGYSSILYGYKSGISSITSHADLYHYNYCDFSMYTKNQIRQYKLCLYIDSNLELLK